MLVVVLRLRVAWIGTLTLSRIDPSSPPFDDADREMAQALADHAALAIGNARSYAAERTARAAAEKATTRFARLSDAGVIGTVVIELRDMSVVEINDSLLDLIGRHCVLDARLAYLQEPTTPETQTRRCAKDWTWTRNR